MSRRFIDDIRADIIANVADNATGDITPLDIRDILTDLADSLTDDEARLDLSTPSLGFVAGANWTPVDIFDESSGDDGEFLNVDVVAGSITTTTTPGYTYQVTAVVAIIGNNNARYDFVITLNGAPLAFIGSGTGQGADDPVTLYATAAINANGASDVIGCSIRTDDPDPIDITDCALLVAVQPTNNP